MEEDEDHLRRFEINLERLKLETPSWLRIYHRSSPQPDQPQAAAASVPRHQTSTTPSRRRARYEDIQRLYKDSSADRSRFWNTRKCSSLKHDSVAPAVTVPTRWDSGSSINNGGSATAASAVSYFAGTSASGATTPDSSSCDSSTCPPPPFEPPPPPPRLKLLEKKPYLGWRSTENLAELANKPLLTPNERLMMPPTKSRSHHNIYGKEEEEENNKDNPEDTWLPRFRHLSEYRVHDSIRNVTNAIIEFCGETTNNNNSSNGDRNNGLVTNPKDDDDGFVVRSDAVPSITNHYIQTLEATTRPPPPPTSRIRRPQTKPPPPPPPPRKKVLWVESSFVAKKK